MKRIAILIILVLGGAGLRANAQKGFTFSSAEYSLVNRQSTLLHNNFAQIGSEVSFQPKWVNIGAGVELDLTDEALTRYFLEERLKLTGRDNVVLRLNHYEVDAWEAGENFINLYYQQKLEHAIWAAGVAYISPVLSDFRNPFKFDPDFDQWRVLYSFAYQFPFRNNKFNLQFGAENFTQYENYGYDHVGPFAELKFQATPATAIKVKGDVRVVGIGTATISAERETLFIGLEWKNVKKSAPAAAAPAAPAAPAAAPAAAPEEKEPGPDK